MLVSCNRRAPTANDGSTTPSEIIHPITGIKFKTRFTIKVNRKNHQYSEREARSPKSMYFWKQVFIDSVKDTFTLSCPLRTALRKAAAFDSVAV